MSLWTQAKSAAERTPRSRNRAADFFRAAAIIVVVLGHWVVNVPYYVDGDLRFTELLVVQPWTQFATWFVQVMPVFFFVGGFSNAASWASSRHDPVKRRAWQGRRMQRLLAPITPLVLVWSGAAGVAGYLGLDPELIRNASRAALIPVWFLAVYIMVTVLVPLSVAAWQRWAGWSIAALLAGAAIVDLLGFVGGIGWVRWANYGFIWLGMHQMGYWWHSGTGGKKAPALLVVAGLALLWLLVGPLGYPIAMISVPGEEISNSRPPTLAMLAIGLVQVGLIILMSSRVSEWLRMPRPWTMVILVSQRIMTVYLWHLTALLLAVGLSLLADGVGMTMVPGSSSWWLTRPVWICLMVLLLAPLIALFGHLEVASRDTRRRAPDPVRAVLGAWVASGGLTFLALDGTYADNILGMNLLPAALAIAGVQLASRGGCER